ncbi:diguanylate cyclase [Paractinoplanes hotanensis]|uniref:Diguanylate cyclase n=1 Tax=Paractinoplanes hotanensis TaxID=2906497 RepID=A0ABT0Y2I2_9ACTN|nr:diguanylate cyclase [Actinoplanes hotanensis]MCM4080244.1 diguanylate cyclase [Actinoplanes hotanensis]
MSDAQVEVLYESARTRVVRSAPAGDRPGLIRKELRGPDAVERCRRERETLTRLAAVPGVVRLAGGTPRDTELVLLDVGDSLATWIGAGHRPMSAVCDVALRLTRVVAAVHAAGVVHKDINPANVVLDGLDPVLIDFELATTAAEERPGFTHQSQVAGTLAYLAPEQTGRTGRAVDRRSDLYALGATLFELVTGRPPFTGANPLELLHDHLARRPVRVTQLVPAAPPMLAAIIDRLLEKEPDRRYQSAEGCAHDLARLGDGPFELGARDFPARLTAPSRLIGRDAEVAVLRTAFDEALAGRVRGLLISGPSGVGKTALVNELRALVTAAGGWFVTGKFDQYRQDTASDAMAAALRALARLLLGENETDLTRLRAVLGPALGDNAGLLAALVPEVAPLLGIEPEPPRGDQAEVQGRLFQAALAFIRTVVSPARPLVLVVDDVQWAAATPTAFIETLLTAEGLPGLLVIGAYREEEVDASHPLSAVLTRWQRLEPPPGELRLRNLPPDDVTTLLAEVLRLPAERAAGLAAAIAPRTGGNPFDSVELINSLRAGGVLAPSDDGWDWDVDAVRRWVGDSDIGDLLVARLDRLPRSCRRVLTVMAALGGETGFDLLAAGLRSTAADVETRLRPALEDGLVVLDEGVAFRHDRVQQAAYALTPPAARRLLHLVLAERLAGRPEHAAVAAQQYLPAAGLVAGTGHRRQVAELLRSTAAGLRMINYPVAERYLAAAAPLAGDDPALLDQILIDHHRALYSLGRLPEADTLWAGLAGRLDPVALAEPAVVQIESLTVRGRAADALDLGRALLGRLGVALPARELDDGLDQLREWAPTLRVDDDLIRADVAEPALVAACRLLARMMPPAFFSDHETMVWLITAARRIWSEHGPSAALVVPLAHSGIAAIGFRRDHATGYRVLRHLEEAGDARGWDAETAAVRFLASVSTTHWFEPVEHSVELARLAYERLVHGGDLAFACFTAHTTVPALLDCAPTLPAFEAELVRSTAFTKRVANEQNAAIMAEFDELHELLTTGPGGPPADTGPGGNPMANAYRSILQALAAAFFGDVPALVARADAIERSLPFIEGNYFTATARFVRAYALLAANRADEAEPLLSWLDQRAADAPANFQHLARWLAAERAWAAGDSAAGGLFDEALQAAGRQRRPWQHAFLAERAGRYQLAAGLGYVGHRLLRDSHERWTDWGATAKVAAQEREFPFLRERRTGAPAAGAGTSTTFASEAVDLMAVVEASRALSSETRIGQLRVRVVEILASLTGATRVHLLTRDDEAGDWTDGRSVITAGRVPLSIVRYVERTQAPLVLDNAVDDPRFAQDPYLDGVELCAVLAVTVVSHGEPRAMLVLENRLWRGTFTDQRLDVVRIIGSQLVVSIENADLYASLERKVADRTEQLRLANAQLQILSGTDALTGLANRRHLDQVLERSWQADGAEPLGLMMIDIDHFKLYNDRLGHAAGDDCLRKVARAIAAAVGEKGLVARYGGEEFTVVLAGAGTAAAVELAERVQRAVHELGEAHPAAPGGVVTVSVGVSCEVPAGDRTVADLVADADDGLYEAKRGGRDQVRTGRRAAPRPAVSS